jgi:NAD(P)-dependent dehydrogenase (short-subunit alcohol dehydrogenase family)
MARQGAGVWFITGCSTGFGRELAKILLKRGDKVVVTARDPQQIQDLVKGHESQALALKLDVTNAAEVEQAAKKAEAAFGSIDVLVNNAGYGYLSATEEGEDAEVRAMFEANFFGLAKMTQAVLPVMRKHRRGVIVNVSSIGGFVGFPGVSYYNASKFAVEGLSEALSKEVEPLGIKVIIVEPGPFRTDWAGRSLKLPMKAIADYAETAGMRRNNISGGSGKQAGDPVRACEAIIKAVESEKPPLRLLLGKMALDTARGKLDQVRGDLDTWKEVSLGADYPEFQTTTAR